MSIVDILRRIPGAPSLATRTLSLSAGVMRSVLGKGSAHVRVRRDGLLFDLDLHEYVQVRIYFNSFDHAEIGKLVSYIRPGDVAIDVGAHIGYYALNFARAVSESGRVIVFEPAPENLTRLRENIALNGFGDRVSVVEAAASDRAGTLRLYLAGSAQGGGNSVYPEMAQTANFVEIDSAKIDDYCEREGIDRVRVMKVDVEGHEPSVLRGCASLLERRRIDVVMIEHRASCVAQIEAEPELFDAPLVSNGYVRIEPRIIPPVDNVFNLFYVSPELAAGR